MARSYRRRFLDAAAVAVLVVAAACSSKTATTSSAGQCTPGQQIACACPGGTSGAQTCNTDGKAYGTCFGCTATFVDASTKPEAGSSDAGAIVKDHSRSPQPSRTQRSTPPTPQARPANNCGGCDQGTMNAWSNRCMAQHNCREMLIKEDTCKRNGCPGW